jgi:hypothetical protein
MLFKIAGTRAHIMSASRLSKNVFLKWLNHGKHRERTSLYYPALTHLYNHFLDEEEDNDFSIGRQGVTDPSIFFDEVASKLATRKFTINSPQTACAEFIEYLNIDEPAKSNLAKLHNLFTQNLLLEARGEARLLNYARAHHIDVEHLLNTDLHIWPTEISNQAFTKIIGQDSPSNDFLDIIHRQFNNDQNVRDNILNALTLSQMLVHLRDSINEDLYLAIRDAFKTDRNLTINFRNFVTANNYLPFSNFLHQEWTVNKTGFAAWLPNSIAQYKQQPREDQRQQEEKRPAHHSRQHHKHRPTVKLRLFSDYVATQYQTVLESKHADKADNYRAILENLGTLNEAKKAQEINSEVYNGPDEHYKKSANLALKLQMEELKRFRR